MLTTHNKENNLRQDVCVHVVTLENDVKVRTNSGKSNS